MLSFHLSNEIMMFEAGLREAAAQPGRGHQEALQHPPQERRGHLQV